MYSINSDSLYKKDECGLLSWLTYILLCNKISLLLSVFEQHVSLHTKIQVVA